MKYSCEIVKDLLPLYCDDVCSKESKLMVEEHLKECVSCKTVLTKMEKHDYDDTLTNERKHVVENYAKKVKRRSVSIGIALASVLVIPVIICLIVNLATGHALDWFFIVLTSLMLFASLSVVPLVVEKKKLLWTLSSSMLSLMLLLITCCLYVNGDWFFVTSISVILGLSVIFGPYVIGELPWDGCAKHKAVLGLALDTILLYVLLLVCGFYLNDPLYWECAFFIATPFVLLVWILCALIRSTKLDAFIKGGIGVLLIGVFTTFTNGFITWVLEGTFRVRFIYAHLNTWHSDMLINANIELLILITTSILGGILIVVGFGRWFGKRK